MSHHSCSPSCGSILSAATLTLQHNVNVRAYWVQQLHMQPNSIMAQGLQQELLHNVSTCRAHSCCPVQLSHVAVTSSMMWALTSQ